MIKINQFVENLEKIWFDNWGGLLWGLHLKKIHNNPSWTNKNLPSADHPSADFYYNRDSPKENQKDPEPLIMRIMLIIRCFN